MKTKEDLKEMLNDVEIGQQNTRFEAMRMYCQGWKDAIGWMEQD